MKLIKIKKGNKTYKYEPQKKYVSDLLKPYLDLKKKCYYLFYKYKGESIDDLINYSDTENVTDMEDMFRYCSNLQTIPQLDTSKVARMNSMFYQCYNLQTIPLLNTSNVTNMGSMFDGCTNLQTIPQLDTSKVTDMRYMFEGCSSLQTIPQLNTSNVTRMGIMFQNCKNLQTIPQLDTSNVTDMEYMFRYCSNLQTIDITSMDKIASTNGFNCMCQLCCSLTKLIIRTMTVIPPLHSTSFESCSHFDGTVNSVYNPEGLKDGRIYVPDDYVDQLKEATNWSAYADIIVPLSTLSE